ncbi:MAG: AsmA-like C-terminal region-containing protein, partial [Geminicoccales bacterium]
AGTGTSLDEVMADADGEGSIVMRDGSVSGLLVEAAGLDVVEALALVVEDARVGIRCGGLDFQTQKGTTQLRNVVIDTTDSVIAAQGQISLDKERLDLSLEARPKDFSLIDAAAPIRISGPFTDLAVEIGGVDPLPFFEMGETGNVDCEALLERIEAR